MTRRGGAFDAPDRSHHIAAALVLVATTILATAALAAHDGPPFPIVSDRRVGPYSISVWTDPDATDDGSAGGQFWVTVERADAKGALPPDTAARVSIRPLGRPGEELSADATPVRGDISNQFAAIRMDHEGPFAVRATVTGALGTSTVDAQVDATYDLRPPAYMLLWYLMPFILIGVLWTRLLLRRRAAAVAATRQLTPGRH